MSCSHENLANNHKHGEEEDEVGFSDGEPMSLLQGEEDCSIQTGFCWEGHMKNFICFWLPDSTQQLLKIRHQGNARTFDPSSNHHNEPPMVIMVVSMMDPNSNFTNSNNLFHRHKDKLDRQEADTLVEKVHGAEENQIPYCRGQEHTRVIAEIINRSVPK